MKKNKENIKNKSFYFDDYLEENYLITGNSKITKISFNRISIIFYTSLCLVFIFTLKLLYYAGFDKKDIYYDAKPLKILKKRGDIKDRNGVLLARNIDNFVAGVRPALIKDKKKFIFDLKFIFPEIDTKVLIDFLNKKRFFYLDKKLNVEKRLTEELSEKLWLLKGSMGNNAIELEPRQTRFYPQQKLFSHILGQVDEDNMGISGIENFFDKKLKSNQIINSSLNLTIDANLQYIIREELINAYSDFKNIGSAAVLLDVESGEILSLVSLPDYDLNRRSKVNDESYFNKITLGVYELGSVFKTFTLAAALENKEIDPQTIFKDLENKIKCDKFTISEHDKLPKSLSAEEILIRSSNIGAVRIAQMIGVDKYKDFLNSLGLFEKINFQIGEVGTPIPFNWGKCKLATASFGHGITTTPLQLARAYAILGNGGYDVQPYLLKSETKKNIKSKKILSHKTSDEINMMLRKVVSLPEGTANFANIQGYDVAGKTGTSLKYKSKAKLNTFVSLFPANRPKYVLLVMLDEPKPAPHLTYFINGYKVTGIKRNESGWNSVYVAGKIIEKIGPTLAINNLQASK